MKKFSIFAAVMIAALSIGLSSCSKDEMPIENSKMLKAPKVNYKEAAEYNSDFDTVAYAVNRLLATNADFRQVVKKEVGKMFDGDYNVLISQLIVNYDFVEKLFIAQKITIRQIVEKYPLIQIAIPMNFEKWDGSEVLPVVYLPFDYQENITEFIQGYDKYGISVSFKENVEPDFPVAVISENERCLVVAGEPDELSPSAPQNLAAATTTVGIKLTWLKPTSGEISGYDVFRKGVGEANYSLIYSLYGEDNLHFEDVSIQPELNYSYYIKAFYEDPAVRFTIVRHQPFILRRPQRISGEKHYSPPSNYVTANSPALAVPAGIRLEHGNAGQLDLEWNGQSSYTAFYEVWRKSATNTNYILRGTTASIDNYFVDNGLSAGEFYRYRVRAKTIGGSYSAWSNSIATSVSDRNIETPFKITKLKFKDVEALKKVESGWRGAPELWLTVVKGDASTNASKITLRYEPSSRKASYENWSNANQTILSNWNPNRDGTVFTFVWIEEDGNWGSY
ncbi:MAG: fibronectin type III domain-containing protein [Prevotellaceae bacterium]|jgi:hypothetical protein|nr:fibronectin type III domain-containing protein [Prevotellaceae bacterium]